MEVADVRKGVLDIMMRAKQRAADRRARADASAQAFDSLLSHIVAPLVRQVANVLRVENYAFSVSTPSGSVRLASDKSSDDFIEISLDTSGDAPHVVGLYELAARPAGRRSRTDPGRRHAPSSHRRRRVFVSDERAGAVRRTVDQARRSTKDVSSP